MMNMSYCRFENTLKALKECYEALDETGFGKLSESEKKAAIRLVKLCDSIAADYIENGRVIL